MTKIDVGYRELSNDTYLITAVLIDKAQLMKNP